MARLALVMARPKKTVAPAPAIPKSTGLHIPVTKHARNLAGEAAASVRNTYFFKGEFRLEVAILKLQEETVARSAAQAISRFGPALHDAFPPTYKQYLSQLSRVNRLRELKNGSNLSGNRLTMQREFTAEQERVQTRSLPNAFAIAECEGQKLYLLIEQYVPPFYLELAEDIAHTQQLTHTIDIKVFEVIKAFVLAFENLQIIRIEVPWITHSKNVQFGGGFDRAKFKLPDRDETIAAVETAHEKSLVLSRLIVDTALPERPDEVTMTESRGEIVIRINGSARALSKPQKRSLTVLALLSDHESFTSAAFSELYQLGTTRGEARRDVNNCKRDLAPILPQLRWDDPEAGIKRVRGVLFKTVSDEALKTWLRKLNQAA